MNPPYPDDLYPTGVEHICLPSGRTVTIAKAKPFFKRWEGTPIEHTFGGKPLVEIHGKPVFAELAIRSLFVEAGWDSRWVEAYGAKSSAPYYFSEWSDTNLKNQDVDPIEDQEVLGLLQKIKDAHDGSSGFWDVFAWKDSFRIFSEAKRSGADKLQDTQLRWLESAIGVGLDTDSFLVVEWQFAA